MTILLNKVDVDTVGNEFVCDGGCKRLVVDAISFGGGTVTIELKIFGGQWGVPKLPDGSKAEFTEFDYEKIDFIANGDLVRATLSGSTGASAVNVNLS